METKSVWQTAIYCFSMKTFSIELTSSEKPVSQPADSLCTLLNIYWTSMIIKSLSRLFTFSSFHFLLVTWTIMYTLWVHLYKLIKSMCMYLYLLLDLAIRHSAATPCSNASGTVRNVDAPNSLPIVGFVFVFDGAYPGRWQRIAAAQPCASACDPAE